MLKVEMQFLIGLVMFSSIHQSFAQALLNTPRSPRVEATPAARTIPWNEIGAKASADYHGGGLSVEPTQTGARMHCVFQRLDAEATEEGLWLTSTVPDQSPDRFRVTANAVRRGTSPQILLIPETGLASAADGPVRFSRKGVSEEYSVSMDGVRQDFLVQEKPAADSLTAPLRLEISVTGARVEATAQGVQLVLEKSGRKIAYSRLRVTDATGKELSARMEVRADASLDAFHSALSVLVSDTDAVYPIRIDPTFSDANWVSMGGIPGVDGEVDATIVDGSGNLYISGFFSTAGTASAKCVAKWNGSSWTALGSGMNNEVYALAVSGTTLYAGGQFTTAGGVSVNGIAQWDGSNWSNVGSGLSAGAIVYALAASGSTVYAGGSFTTAGGVSVANIAQWNGSTWSGLGSGMTGGTVRAVAASGGNLYAGGFFTSAGGVSGTLRIAQWNGSAWSALGTGMGGTVLALAVSGTSVYAGGGFTTAGGVSANHIALWNGSTWSALSIGTGGQVNALAVSGSTVYAGGQFTTAGGISASNIAKWNGTAWSALGTGVGPPLTSPTVYAMVASGANLYVGGTFTLVGGVPAICVAQWNGSTWTELGTGLNNYVNALAVSGTNLFVGGASSSATNILAVGVAELSGTNWSALGTGTGGNIPTVYALAVSGANLYAGGKFTLAGGVSAPFIAQWNGSSWSALGSGMNNTVNALAVFGGNLYAGGLFTTAGGVAATNIAKWNGSSWSAVGSGIGNFSQVNALAASGTALYVGGAFTTAGGVNAANIAQWDGTNWSALGSGMDGNVNALVVSGTSLYAGGTFLTVGGVAANRVAQWNGSTWSALGSGINSSVNALAVSGTTLFAGGGFTTAGGLAATNIAQWDGASWSPLGSGMNSAVSALAVLGTNLYAGGQFTTAGGKLSAYLAKANLPPIAAVTLTRTAGASPSTYGAALTFQASLSPDPGDGSTIIFLANGVAIGTNTTTSATAALTVTNLPYSPSAYTVTANFTGNATYGSSGGTLSGGQQVNQVPLTITANSDNKTYGQTRTYGAGSTAFTNSALVNGETMGSVTITASGGANATGPVGSYNLTPSAATGGSFNPANYAITYNPGTFTVSQASLSITANNDSKPYGQAKVYGAAMTNFTSSGLVNNETIGSVTISAGGGTATNDNPGAYSLTPSAATGGSFNPTNYSITYHPGTLTVTPAPLSITANNDSKLYGQARVYGAGMTNFTSSGLVNGETIGTVTVAASGGTATNDNAGSYSLTPSAAIGGSFNPANYSITYSNGILTVSPLPVVLTGTRAYDGTTNADHSILSVSNFVGSDTVNVAAGVGGLSAGTVGVQSLTSVGTLALSNNAASNYTLAGASGSVTITQAATSVGVNSSRNPSGFRDSVYFTATLPVLATGSVVFRTNNVLFDTQSLSNGATASVVTEALPQGTNLVIAEYAGDGNYFGSTNTLNQVVTNQTLASASVGASSNGSVTIQFTGTPGDIYWVLATTNLAGPWQPVFTNAAGPDGVVTYIDTVATNYPHRYYRGFKP